MCLVGLSLPAGTAMAGESLAEMIAGPDWPHSHAQFKPDSEARFGRLDTGLRYVIYRNTAQGRSTSMRFLVAAGSLQERDDQLGIAHFVEHMAFRGSKNLKDGELKRIVEAEGFGFGSDVNAFTGYETTKYVLDLPGNDLAQIDVAFSFVARDRRKSELRRRGHRA
ncbi:insulinase Peptidase family M16 family protein [Asticcacaulis biprosthecium C19]|uniref:Insulinase Peptidase family M16 family protein n=1 Tax=Asticcacaulis biprosthecium C19 TaxID=715226 RepID=F4QP53_9CAUL|nr:insulinase Peptidase family M16 family protein [Asticcacaulis biprosthecium C19]